MASSPILGLVAAVLGLLGMFLAGVWWGARTRSHAGVPLGTGDAMLLDLRARLAAQPALADLPAGWHVEVVRRVAHGEAFGGDFVVAARTAAAATVELVLVDVSGKGVDAGARAIQLSGAFGGLLGAVPVGDFLPAANRYLARQGWREGFATAIHLAVDTGSGDFQVRSAGHPPAVHFHAGSGEWELLGARGPALGLLSDADFGDHQGQFAPGDALLLYTDGLVETPQRDLDVGIDRLLGLAEALVTTGFHDGARALVAAAPDGDADDRACILVWRAG